MQRFGETTAPSFIKEFKHGVYHGGACRANERSTTPRVHHPGRSICTPTPLLKSTGVEKYGVALGILALRIFRRGRTWHRVSKGKVVVCKLKQSAPSRVEKYGVAPPKLPFQIFPPTPYFSSAR